MEAAFWILAIIAAVVIVIIYIVTSVGKYSDTVAGKYLKNDKEKEEEKKFGG